MNISDLARNLVKDAIVRETMMDAASLQEQTPFEEYGIESVMSVSIIRVLEDSFGELSKSLLFEFPTIGDLVEHLVDEHQATLTEKLAEQGASTPAIVGDRVFSDRQRKEQIGIASVNTDEPVRESVIPAPNTMAAEAQKPVQQSLPAVSRTEESLVPPVFGTMDSSAESTGGTAGTATQSAKLQGTALSHREATHDQQYSDNDVAIIGIAGRFPQADDIETFWNNLVDGKDSITTIPERLWKWQDFWDESKGVAGKSYLKWGGFLNDHRNFDPLFFGMSKLEAESVDPQERVFLETVHHTFEDAGYNRKKISNYRVGLYVGIMWGQYQLYGAMDASAGSSYASIANRASYFFDLRGPSIPLDTMCSGSMTTVHLACESIRSGESDMAIAGGVNLTTHPNKYFVLSKTGFASSHGRCKSFSADGDGYVPSEGVGTVLLKSMKKALQDGDRIHGVIRATAINHGGKVNGFTVPSAQAQEELVTMALEKSKLDPSTITYVEAHAPGTALGDPIEVRGLTTAFRKHTDNKQFCSIGSVKSNIGHLESAASFASIAKVVKQLEEKTLVPSIHLENENPNIQFDKTPFYLQKSLTPWKLPLRENNGRLEALPRRAAINSFGAGGANAHMIVEEYIAPTFVGNGMVDDEQLFLLSARDDITLNSLMNKYISYIDELLDMRAKIEESDTVSRVMEALNQATSISSSLLSNDDLLINLLTGAESSSKVIRAIAETCNVLLSEQEIDHCRTVSDLKSTILAKVCSKYVAEGEAERRHLRSMAYTMQTGREHLSCRLGIVAGSLAGLKSVLLDVLSEKQSEKIARGKVKNVALLPKTSEQDQQFIGRLMQQRNLTRIAELWCKGVDIDWEGFYEARPGIVSLPQYPFAKIICWAPTATLTASGQVIASGADSAAQSSAAGGSVDGSKGTADESYLLGKAYLKQGFLAGKLLEASLEQATKGSLQLEDIAATAQLTDLASVTTKDAREESGIRLSLFSVNDEKPVAQGQFKPSEIFKSEVLSVDIGSRMQKNPELVTHTTGLPGLEGVATAPSIAIARYTEVAGVSPSVVAMSVLHQLLADEGGTDETDVSYAFSRDLLVMSRVSEKGWVVLHKHDDGSFDAFILNESREPSVYCQNIVDARTLQADSIDCRLFNPVFEPVSKTGEGSNGESTRKNTACLAVFPQGSEPDMGKLVDACHFEKVYAMTYGAKCATELMDSTHWQINVNDLEDIEHCLKHVDSIGQVMFFGGSFNEGDAGIEPVQEVAFFHKLMQQILTSEWSKDENFSLHAYTRFCELVEQSEPVSRFAGGLSGYIRSLAREYPKLRLRLADVDWQQGTQGNALIETYVQLRNSANLEVFHRGEEFLNRRVIEFSPETAQTPAVFRQEGVYLLVGGAGTVGYQLSEYLAKNYQARIVWVNRSPLSDARKHAMDAINQLGGECHYYALDVQDAAQLQEAVDDICGKFGRVDGVVHLAMERDICRISELSDDLLRQRIGAKIAGTENLAQAFKGREPDFMLLFSSAEAYVGSTGWSAYTSGCSYQTQIAQRISQQGIPTFAVNWGFWEGVDENIVEMLKNKGLRFLNIRDGINVIKYVLGNQCHQLVALKAEDRVVDQMGFEKLARPQEVISPAVDAEKNAAVQADATQTQAVSAPVATVSGAGSLSGAALNQENLQKALISLFAQVLKLDESDMDANEDMLNYGVDSLIVLNIQTELENRAGQVSVNLLLENQTISDIATAMLADYREQAAALLGTVAGDETTTEMTGDGIAPSSEQASPVSQAESTAIIPKVPENLSVLRAMALDEGETFLKGYHQLYQDKALMTEPLEGSVVGDYAADGVLHGLVDSGQGNMEVFVSGQGIPVVLMPAVAVTAPTWLYLLNSRLREKYQFIVVHPPGYGMSEPVKECNTKGIVSAVMGTLDALGIRRPFHLVGSCLGCAASIYLAKTHPERVASLTLVGAFHDTSDLNVNDPDNMSGAQFEELAKSAVESLREDFQAVIDNLKETEAWQADIIRERRDLLLNSQCVNFLVALRYLNEMMSMSLLPWLPEVGVATHCIYGDVDKIITPRHSKEISQGIKGAQLTCIPGSAHFPYLTHEKMFVPVLEGFIDDQERKQIKTVTEDAVETVN
ncbi:hypothetical protein BTA51_14455 [Hahella sp. CCB-MM4]|uniref:alpha/beta fold hydrolase n=1 Tax=Hahella sp. (strain CCB-MM4) TaxID=1926491 RepID=UPI000B9A5B8A|nr:alpha/beta fold hydrolase [Hahella sp. CCB-MM4]OZG72723.1 hypothetical protein BTA51_14455 [Hahella sp. CCB-MM4]